MREFTLDCTQITDKTDLHKTLCEGLNFPDWYGNNLDALYDCLTGITDDICIIVDGFDDLEEKLGKYALSMRKAMLQAADDNEKIRVAFI